MASKDDRRAVNWMITIDNGSTFTDGCLITGDGVASVKVLTTPYDLMRCFTDVFRGLAREAGLASEEELLKRVEEVRYSTTSGTNALLVRSGVRVGLVTGPEGAADVYGLAGTAPELLHALVGDRVTGVDLAQASAEEVDQRILVAIRELLARGAQWIVVSLPEPRGSEMEVEFKRRYMKLLPGHLLGSVPVLFSRELCADPDDARRTATAVLNGFLHREMARFLYHADGWLRERHVIEPLRIMRNDGGCGRVAKTTAVKTLDSGPMGGLSGAAMLSRLYSAGRLVTVDVGGTSADIGLVENERPVEDLFGRVHELPLSFAFPALRTAALGGGSLFRVRDGAIAIGPDSAGALPGPVSFGRGGEDPTLTDAVLVAGYLDPARFAGGAITLRPDLAEKTIAERIARPLGLEGARAGAWAMIEAFGDRLGGEIRRVLDGAGWSTEKTRLATFGGSGPLVACLAAERAGLREVVIPPAPASFSALGVGFAELAHDYRAIVSTPVEEADWRETLRSLHERGERDLFGEGVPAGAGSFVVRLRAEADGRDLAGADSAAVPAALKSAGGRVVLDHRASLPGSGRPRLPAPSRREQASSGPRERTLLLDGHPVAAPVVDADALRDGDRGSGPCLLESPYWSAVIPRGWTWMNGELGLRLTKEKS